MFHLTSSITVCALLLALNAPQAPAATVIDSGDQSTVTWSAEELRIYNRAKEAHGMDWLQRVLDAHIADRIRVFREQDHASSCDRYQKLPQARRDIIDKELGGQVC